MVPGAEGDQQRDLSPPLLRPAPVSGAEGGRRQRQEHLRRAQGAGAGDQRAGTPVAGVPQGGPHPAGELLGPVGGPDFGLLPRRRGQDQQVRHDHHLSKRQRHPLCGAGRCGEAEIHFQHHRHLDRGGLRAGGGGLQPAGHPPENGFQPVPPDDFDLQPHQRHPLAEKAVL